MNARIFVRAYACVSAMGPATKSHAQTLRSGQSPGMGISTAWRKKAAPAFVGAVAGDFPSIQNQEHNTRNNRILQACLTEIDADLQAAIAAVGRNRFAIVAGTSTSGIAEAEDALLSYPPGEISADYEYGRQEFGSPAAFLADLLGTTGPAFALSTACTSSTNAFISARRLLRQGLADAVLVVGADSLCRTTVEGFISLEAVATDLCQPMSVHRKGINIGEAAGVFLLSRESAPIELLGVGESCDAYHLSSPDPQGRGAEAAIRAALHDAGLAATDIDYVNLHATGTTKNDQMESLAMARVFPAGVTCSGTKPLTGHALGAAGAIEAALCCVAITDNIIPPHLWDGQPDPDLPPLRLAGLGQSFPAAARRICMTNNFAFGGSNVSLIFSATR
jgi:3-oxoacyl-[acyl-carrier-protein] synthase I